MTGQVYNVASEKMNYSEAQICAMIRKQVDYYLHLADVGEDGDKRNYVVSYNRIRSLGYDASVSMEDGMELARGLEVLDVRNPYSDV